MGTVVDADSFRVNNLVVILRSLVNINAQGPAVKRLVMSMCKYVERSLGRASGLLLQPNDASQFLFVLGQADKRGIPGAQAGLITLAVPARALCQSLSQGDREKVQQVYNS